MSEKDIERWQDTIAPREAAPQPWTIGSGGSWDMLNVQPIPDSMLAELAKRYHSHGCPWNCRSLPLSPSDREYMYLLYFSMQGLVARMRLAERQVADLEASSACAFAFADQAMYERLRDEAVPIDNKPADATSFALTDEEYHEVSALEHASPALQESVQWLRDRGYVAMARDEDGEFVNVLRRPGEDA